MLICPEQEPLNGRQHAWVPAPFAEELQHLPVEGRHTGESSRKRRSQLSTCIMLTLVCAFLAWAGPLGWYDYTQLHGARPTGSIELDALPCQKKPDSAANSSGVCNFDILRQLNDLKNDWEKENQNIVNYTAKLDSLRKPVSNACDAFMQLKKPCSRLGAAVPSLELGALWPLDIPPFQAEKVITGSLAHETNYSFDALFRVTSESEKNFVDQCDALNESALALDPKNATDRRSACSMLSDLVPAVLVDIHNATQALNDAAAWVIAEDAKIAMELQQDKFNKDWAKKNETMIAQIQAEISKKEDERFQRAVQAARQDLLSKYMKKTDNETNGIKEATEKKLKKFFAEMQNDTDQIISRQINRSRTEQALKVVELKEQVESARQKEVAQAKIQIAKHIQAGVMAAQGDVSDKVKAEAEEQRNMDVDWGKTRAEWKYRNKTADVQGAAKGQIRNATDNIKAAIQKEVAHGIAQVKRVETTKKITTEQVQKSKIYAEAAQELSNYKEAFKAPNLHGVEIMVKLSLDAEPDQSKKKEIIDQAIKEKEDSLYATADLTWQAVQSAANRTYDKAVAQQSAAIRQKAAAKEEKLVLEQTEATNEKVEDVLGQAKEEMVTDVMQVEEAAQRKAFKQEYGDMQNESSKLLGIDVKPTYEMEVEEAQRKAEARAMWQKMKGEERNERAASHAEDMIKHQANAALKHKQRMVQKQEEDEAQVKIQVVKSANDALFEAEMANITKELQKLAADDADNMTDHIIPTALGQLAKVVAFKDKVFNEHLTEQKEKMVETQTSGRTGVVNQHRLASKLVESMDQSKHRLYTRCVQARPLIKPCSANAMAEAQMPADVVQKFWKYCSEIKVWLKHCQEVWSIGSLGVLHQSVDPVSAVSSLTNEGASLLTKSLSGDRCKGASADVKVFCSKVDTSIQEVKKNLEQKQKSAVGTAEREDNIGVGTVQPQSTYDDPAVPSAPDAQNMPLNIKGMYKQQAGQLRQIKNVVQMQVHIAQQYVRQHIVSSENSLRESVNGLQGTYDDLSSACNSLVERAENPCSELKYLFPKVVWPSIASTGFVKNFTQWLAETQSQCSSEVLDALTAQTSVEDGAAASGNPDCVSILDDQDIPILVGPRAAERWRLADLTSFGGYIIIAGLILTVAFAALAQRRPQVLLPASVAITQGALLCLIVISAVRGSQTTALCFVALLVFLAHRFWKLQPRTAFAVSALHCGSQALQMPSICLGVTALLLLVLLLQSILLFMAFGAMYHLIGLEEWPFAVGFIVPVLTAAWLAEILWRATHTVIGGTVVAAARGGEPASAAFQAISRSGIGSMQPCGGTKSMLERLAPCLPEIRGEVGIQWLEQALESEGPVSAAADNAVSKAFSALRFASAFALSLVAMVTGAGSGSEGGAVAPSAMALLVGWVLAGGPVHALEVGLCGLALAAEADDTVAAASNPAQYQLLAQVLLKKNRREHYENVGRGMCAPSADLEDSVDVLE